MANWEDHFHALHYKDLDYDDVPSVTESYVYMQHEYFDMPICQDEVMSVISNMKKWNIPWHGIHGMPVEILKCFNLPTCNTTFCKNGALH